jgi:chromosome segregation ATPase
MSSTGIDLPNTGNQLSDLLAFITDPAAYKAKLDNLEKAAKYANDRIALAGPADEILAIRADIASKQTQAAQAFEDAKANIADITAKATAQADTTIADAKDQAKKLIDAAKDKTNAANALMEKAQAIQKQVDAALAAVAAMQADYEKKSASLDARMAAAITAQTEAEAYRDSLAAKAQAFAQGL